MLSSIFCYAIAADDERKKIAQSDLINDLFMFNFLQ
tara:strand:+ start:3941 stop:4048 length:108 start_codon:yes stop_codon:yes gene_type:complete